MQGTAKQKAEISENVLVKTIQYGFCEDLFLN